MQENHPEIVELTRQLRDMKYEYWLNETLFTFNWWILFFTIISIFLVWIIILDKSRMMEIITYGLLVAITGITMDVVGVSLTLWQYPHPLIPLPAFDGVQIIQMPVIYMVIYQYFHKWKAFLIASIINAFVFSFMLEPLLEWLQSYELSNWKHIYSFFPYIIIAVLYKWVISKFKKLDKNYS